jgi:two-component system sensor histidine kinase AlgZ
MPGMISDPTGMFVLKSVFAVGLVAVVFFRYLEIRARWRLELIAQAEARVQALQARIRPHFLFNSLNTIASLIPDDPASAETATLDLADIFRGSMRRADQLISLSDELELARQYLDMERRRLGERLEVDWRVDELPAGAAVLPLMLQPLLENAVAHGIQALHQGGKIAVYGRTEGDQVVITIGNPLAPEDSNAGGHGMAIRNIRERLSLAFGSRASLLTSQDNERFYAVLSLPYVEHSDH